MTKDFMRCHVAYRYISPSDYHTPLMYLPIQRTRIPVALPVNHESVVDALMGAVETLELRRGDIHDVTFTIVDGRLLTEEEAANG